MEEGVGEFVGQQELAAVEACRDAVCDGCLRLAAMVAVRCVEIVESGSNESIGHAAEFVVVDGSAFLLRQSHATKSEVAVYFRKERIGGHILFLQYVLDKEIAANDLEQHAGNADAEVLETEGERAEHERLDK